MNETGELIEWNDDRGFGFVQPLNGGRLFVHISAFERALRRPEAGDHLAFQRGPGKDGREAVVSAQIVGATRAPRPSVPSVNRIESAQLARAFRLLAAAVLVAAFSLLRLPAIVPWIYLVMGAVSFLAYALDKRAARVGAWRIPEARLHGIDALGGTVGGLLAQVALHHKTMRPAFTVVTFGIALCHLATMAALALWPGELLIVR